MRETLLLNVPHRQVVFTIPKMLRIFFKYKRWLLGELCRLALRALSRYFEVMTGSALTPGVVAVIQTFGDRINFHPHLHFLVTEGGTDEAGIFHLTKIGVSIFHDSLFTREEMSVGFPVLLSVPAACEFAFSYFEGNLTSDHAAIYRLVFIR